MDDLNASLQVVVRGIPLPISYKSEGQGNTILLLHGWAHSMKIWAAVTAHLVQKGHRVVGVDLPGFGASPAPPRSLQTMMGYSLIVEKLLDRLESTTLPSAIIADSLSARIVYGMLARYSGSCRKFLLSGCPFDGLPLFLQGLQMSRAVQISVATLQKLPKALSRLVIWSFAWYTIRERRGNMAAIYDGLLRSDPTVAQNMLAALAEAASATDLSKLTGAKIVLLRGQFDRVVTHRSQRRWAKRIPAVCIEVKGASHTPMVEEPLAYAQAIASLMV